MDRQQLLERIAFADPKPPRKLNRRIPVELETIVLKAMAKEPAQRYNTAGDLADDLERFLLYKPIKTKPPTLLEQVAKWSMRHQSLMLSGVALLLFAMVALTISTVIVLGQKAETARALEKAENNFSSSETHRRKAEQAVDFTEKLLYVRNLSLAARARKDSEMRRAAAHRPELRGFEWHYLRQLVLTEHLTLTQQQGEVFAARSSPDGKLIAIGAEDGSVELWDPHTRTKLQVLRGGDHWTRFSMVRNWPPYRRTEPYASGHYPPSKRLQLRRIPGEMHTPSVFPLTGQPSRPEVMTA